MDKQLIIKFIQKRYTPDEAIKVIEWMHSKDFEPELLKSIENDLKASLNSEGELSENLKATLQSILLKDQIDQIDSGKQYYGKANKNNSRPWRLWKVAASVLIVFSLSYYFTNYNKIHEDLPPEAQFIIKENSKGRKSTLYLPDGSIVNLNSDSEIRYRENFSDTVRLVYLEGEAFFEVSKDTFRSFVILTDDISVTALGTSFNICSYKEEDKIAVSLASGNVMVEDVNQIKKIILEPGQKIQYTKKTSQFTDLQKFDEKSEYSWKEGILYFRSAKISEVVPRLERWFGVEISIENRSPVLWSYTGEFNNQSLKSVLESLSFSQNFTYTINGKIVKIKFNND